MDHIQFSLTRLHLLWDDWDQPEFLAEIAYLYDRIVQSGSKEPVIDCGMKLFIPFDEVGAAIAYSMSSGYISAPKRGTFGGTITNKARKVLGQPIVRKTKSESR